MWLVIDKIHVLGTKKYFLCEIKLEKGVNVTSFYVIGVLLRE